MPAKLPKFSYPVPSNKNGQAFSSAKDLLSKLGGESSGQYLVGSQGMWHGGIHITDTTIPWCALSTDSEAEKAYYNGVPYKGEQFIRCMADGEIVAFRVCKDYESEAIEWRGEKLQLSSSFVLVKHYIQPGETSKSGLTFYTLYMNLAPFAAYSKPGDELDRKTAGSQRYYASADDTQAGSAIGSLAKDMRVTLSDNIITRTSDRRQFTEVTLTAETKNAAGATLAAGTKIWTVSDQGSLKVTSSIPAPSWWATLAYGTQRADVVNCTTSTDWSFYLSREDVLQRKSVGKLAAGFPLAYEPGNAAQQVIRPGERKSDAPRTFSLCTLGRDVGKLKKGDRVWVVSDGDSLTASPKASGTQPVFGDVVKLATPIGISAGDSIGHMGFYQLPEENGKRSRYQVHIECLSMDDKLPTFLTNPEHVGADSPVFLKYPEGAVLCAKNAEGIMKATDRKTRAPGILTLSGVPVITAGEEVTHYQIHPEGGWLDAANIQKVSQYALGELGFVTLDKAPESFDLIDGIKHPDNVVKGILGQMYKAAQDETRTSHALNKYNYKRLLDRIDCNQDGHYSEEEYLQAIHNESYRDALYRIIVKHSSEWYYGKEDPLWKTYLDTLTNDALLWKTYTETFIDKMAWMKKVLGMGPEPWHMHPVVFLDAMSSDDEMDLKWLTVPKGQLTFDAEGNDQNTSPWFSRKIHWPGGVSGITIGRGYDLGQQNTSNADLSNVGINSELKAWLVVSQGMSGANANERFNAATENIRSIQITRKQQYKLFVVTYENLEEDVKRISQKIATIQAYHPNPQISVEQAWNDIPDKIKEILVDLRYRGDYTPNIRSLLQRHAYTGDLQSFGQVLSNQSNWPNVPQDRFTRRVQFYAN